MSHRARMAVFAFGALGTAVLFVAGALRLPDFGAAFHPYGDRAVREAVLHRTPNVISSINFDQRAFDTVGEELILFASALGAVVLLRVVGREETESGVRHRHGAAEVFDALRLVGVVLLPITLVTGVYVVAHGHLSPGGGFQGGVVLGTAIHLIYLTGDYPALARLRPIPLFEAGEAIAAGAFVALALLAAGAVPALNVAVGVEVGCALVMLVAKFFDQALLVREVPE
ncbi:sodium:proton antiporter [Actinomadura barringtoniae]|uniref:Sodium:proton antiporter n=1 Tax=Actinomadura barringtoniae TaxID=1427535 RepID=A0A939PG93_9ACTN|nr:MnhB domain-containing protein [Actinomadura barringtoniae]MBO2449523.1 sodium:proton antiporter [Actinomadura barringtoniae]